MTENLVECNCMGNNPNCVHCNGFGMVRKNFTEEIRLPPFSNSNQQLNSSNYGINSILSESSGEKKYKKWTAPKITGYKPKKQCPFCSVITSTLRKHMVKTHPDQLKKKGIRVSATENKKKEENNLKKTTKLPQKKKAYKAKKETKKKIIDKPEISSQFSLKIPLIDASHSSNKDLLSKLNFMICDKCGGKVRKDLYVDHCRRVHSKATQDLGKKRVGRSDRRTIIIDTDRTKKGNSNRE